MSLLFCLSVSLSAIPCVCVCVVITELLTCCRLFARAGLCVYVKYSMRICLRSCVCVHVHCALCTINVKVKDTFLNRYKDRQKQECLESLLLSKIWAAYPGLCRVRVCGVVLPRIKVFHTACTVLMLYLFTRLK